MNDTIIQRVSVYLLPILVSITLHELSHGYVAYMLGDKTAKLMGRLTLNPIAHIDIFGTIIMPILLLVLSDGQFAFGYAKPVPINPLNFKNPRKDMAISAAAGPVTNIILAAISMLILRFIFPFAGDISSHMIAGKVLKPIILMLKASVMMNIFLAAFNLIPIPPLDGGRVLTGILPYRQAIAFSKIEPYGMVILLILIATGMTDYFVMPLARLILDILSVIRF